MSYDPRDHNYREFWKEAELREAAAAAGIALHINTAARRACKDFIELYAANQVGRPLVGAFSDARDAIAFLRGGGHGR